LLRQLWRPLVEPARVIDDPSERRSARLLAVFLLSLVALFVATNAAYLIGGLETSVSAADQVGYVILLVSYALSRSRYYRAAALLMLVMFPMVVFANVLSGTSANVAASLAFLVPGYILASIFLAPRGVVAYGALVSAAVVLLPRFAPGVVPAGAAVLGTAAAGLIVVALLAIAMRHRDSIERDHRVQLRRAYDHALEGWSRALELRDKETEGHSRRVTELSVQLARACGLDGELLEDVYRGALLHDIGKMAVPDHVLRKPGPLTDEEWTVMRRHTTVAAEMLAGVPFLEPALRVAESHHEHWDGTGYPRGLRGEDIPLLARIFTVVDVWDALLSHRPYRDAWPRDRVLAHLREQRGRQFDPAVVDRFLALQA